MWDKRDFKIYGIKFFLIFCKYFGFVCLCLLGKCFFLISFVGIRKRNILDINYYKVYLFSY